VPSSAADILLTPTARLARQLAREQALEASAHGRKAWLPTSVATFNSWLQQLRQEHLLMGRDERVPITHHQAELLWQSVIDHEVFVGEPQVAGLAQQAWRTLHEYVLPAPQAWPELLLSEDSRRFQSWSQAYQALCNERGLVDEWAFAAGLPALIRSGEVTIPHHIALVGFDLPLTPLQHNILAACEAAGARVEQRHAERALPGAVEITECITADDELFAAARWARALLQQNVEQSIAVVVPDLAGRVDRVERIFRQIFDPPGYTLRQQEREAWHISMGKPLHQWSLVSDALSILNLNTYRITQPQAHQLLRSPFVSGAGEREQAEAQGRQRALQTLAQRAPYGLTVTELQYALRDSHAQQLADALDQWLACRQRGTHAQSASAWVGQFQAELSSLGFAAGRSLDSREYQTLNRWHEVLEAFSTLDLVADRTLSRSRALTLLGERAAGVVFRERNPGAPVEILGVEEALGSRFDALWLTSLDSDTWPGPTRRDALIPAPLQTAVPRASSESCLQRAQAELGNLLQLAPQVHGSYARGSDEVAAQVTALISPSDLAPAAALPTPAAASMQAPMSDCEAPPLTQAGAAGGTAVLRKQSACPFRAFAEHRLGAVEIAPPRPGLNAAQRGTITHKALEQFFRGVADQAALLALDSAEQTARVQQAVDTALEDFTRAFRLTLSTAGRLLEQQRTERVLHRWLDLERQRGGFRITAQERSVEMNIGGVTLRGSIDRLDQLEDGGTLLIDYKTGRSSKADWFPEARIIDPQLPAYALSMATAPQGIAFAHIRPEHLRFEGLADGDSKTPGVNRLKDESYKYKQLDSWPQLLAQWQTHLLHLGEDFAAGHAAVDPRTPRECDHCHLQGLCRVLERAPFDSLQEEQDFE